MFEEMNKVVKPIDLPQSGHEIKFFSMLLGGVLTIIGFFLHYLFPVLRNPNPWGLFKTPWLRNHEFRKFEVTEPAKVMWFEMTTLVLIAVEKNVILPLAILNETWIAFDSDYFDNWSPIAKAICLTICVMKLLRHSFRSRRRLKFLNTVEENSFSKKMF